MTRNEYNTAVEKFADGLYRFIVKNLKNEESARDIVQDVYTKLWVKHREVQFEKAKSYLFTAGYHTMLDFIKKQKRIGGYDEVIEHTHMHQQQYSDLAEILETALQRLPDIQRSAIMLRDYEGYAYQEIGEILQLNESQVKVYIFRARKTLQEYLKSVETIL